MSWLLSLLNPSVTVPHLFFSPSNFPSALSNLLGMFSVVSVIYKISSLLLEKANGLYARNTLFVISLNPKCYLFIGRRIFGAQRRAPWEDRSRDHRDGRYTQEEWREWRGRRREGVGREGREKGKGEREEGKGKIEKRRENRENREGRGKRKKEGSRGKERRGEGREDGEGVDREAGGGEKENSPRASRGA